MSINKQARMQGFGVRSSSILIALLVFLPASQLSAYGTLQDAEIDTETLKLVKQGWRKAFTNSHNVKQVQATSRMTSDTQPGVVAVEVHSFAIRGHKRLYASSHNGHMGDLTAKVSSLRLFDGTNEVLANSADLFQVAASDRENWAVESLNQTGQTNPLIERMFAFIQSAGVQIAHSAFSLDYFELGAPHVVIKELRPDPNSANGLVTLFLEFDRKKYQGNNPMGVLEARMKLDPEYDYLPIEATALGVGGVRFTDYFVYQLFQDSFYLKSRKGTSVLIKDGGVVSEGKYQQEIQLFSTETPPDHMFRLTTYGLTEPKPRGRIDNGFRAWHLIVVGVVIVGVGLIYRRLKSQRDAV